MAEFNGMDGSVVFAAGYAVNVKSWSVTDEVTLARTINFDSPDDYEVVLKGAKRWSGTIVCDMDDATAIPESGVSGAATLNAKTGFGWAGTIVVERIENQVQKSADAIEITFSFQGSGAPTGRPS